MKPCDPQLLSLYCELLEMDQRMRENYSQQTQAERFTPCQIRYLQIIDSKKRLTSSEFAQLMQISKPTVSQLINRLTTHGCVYKEHSSQDRRICYIQLTPKGEQIARAEQQAREQIVKHIQERLSDDEITTLTELLEKLR